LSRESDITSVVIHDLANRAQVAFDSGIQRQAIVVDPGFGFGKNFEENYPLLAHLEQLQKLDFPLLAGASRKSFIGRTIGKRRGGEDAAVEDRQYGSVAAMVASILHGAHIVRVHDVASAVDAAAVADAVLAGGK
jgi:dihydropteroate synthase